MLEQTIKIENESPVQNEQSFTIKGVQQYIELQITPGVNFMKLRNDLECYFESKINQTCYQGEVFVLQIGDYEMEWHQFEHLKHYLKTWAGIDLIIHPDWGKKFFADQLSQPSYLKLLEKIFVPSSQSSPNVDLENAIVVKNTLRAGEWVKHDKDIIVFGDVHDSASVYSKKNVIVLGKIRGKVSSGIDEHTDAFIFSLQMSGGHLVIGGIEKDLKGINKTNPVIAYLKQKEDSQRPMIQIDLCYSFHSLFQNYYE